MRGEDLKSAQRRPKRQRRRMREDEDINFDPSLHIWTKSFCPELQGHSRLSKETRIDQVFTTSHHWPILFPYRDKWRYWQKNTKKWLLHFGSVWTPKTPTKRHCMLVQWKYSLQCYFRDVLGTNMLIKYI